MTDLDIIKECRQTGRTRTTTEYLLEKAYYEQMTKEIDISTVLIEGDTATIMGVKYKRVEDTQPFYNKLWGLLKTKLGDTVDCDEMADRVRDLIREHIPEPKKGPGLPEYSIGFNEAIRQVKMRLFNGI